MKLLLKRARYASPTTAIPNPQSSILNPQSARDDIVKEVAKYNFFHDIEIIPGLVTSGFPGIEQFTQTICKIADQVDFKGKRVLDVGCRDGAMLLYAESRGAAEIYGVDNDFSAGLANFIVPFKNSKIQTVECNVNELDQQDLGQFDIIFLCGIVYHLQAPFWGLRQIRDALRPGGTLIIETAIVNAFDDFPLVAYFAGDKSPYEPSSPTFFNLAGLQQATSLLGLESYGTAAGWGLTPYDLQKNCPEFAKKNNMPHVDTYRYTGLYERRVITKAVPVDYFEGLHDNHNRGRDRGEVRPAA